MKSISQQQLNKLSDRYDKTKNHSFYTNSISNNDINEVFLNRKYIKKWNNTFSTIIQPEIKVANQRHSGRCWLFSFTNLLRLKLIQHMNLEEDFQLSQNYLHFYDKLEKCHYFLQLIYKLKHLDINNRLVKYLLSNPISDGGFWNMACNLVEKYGIVPLDNMKETHQSKNTKKLNKILNLQMRRIACYIRNTELDDEKFKKYLEDKMYSIYKILVFFLGKPPTTFDWEYYIKSDNNNTKIKKTIRNLNPQKFMSKYVHFNPNDYNIFMNLPIKFYPFYKKYKFKYCNNMLDGRPPEFINLPIKEFVRLVKRSIDNNEPIWFGSDVEKYFSRKKGIANTKVFDFELIQDKKEELSKGSKILYHQSQPNHAMLIQGYNLNKQDEIDRLLIQNSWGDEVNDGFVNMSIQWFKKYCYEIVIKHEYLDNKIKDIVKQKEVTSILPWEAFPCEALYVK